MTDTPYEQPAGHIELRKRAEANNSRVGSKQTGAAAVKTAPVDAVEEKDLKSNVSTTTLVVLVFVVCMPCQSVISSADDLLTSPWVYSHLPDRGTDLRCLFLRQTSVQVIQTQF